MHGLQQHLTEELRAHCHAAPLEQAVTALSDFVFNATLRAIKAQRAETTVVTLGCAPHDVTCQLTQGHINQHLSLSSLIRSMIYEQQWPVPTLSRQFHALLAAPQDPAVLRSPRWNNQIHETVKTLILTTDLMVGSGLRLDAAFTAVLEAEQQGQAQACLIIGPREPRRIEAAKPLRA